MAEIYISVDIEADGPIPGEFSMLSLGAAAFERGDVTPVSTFEVNLKELPEAHQSPDTMQWWARQDPKVWEYIRKDPLPPADAMRAFRKWCWSLKGKRVLVTWPAWDYVFVLWYLVKFLGERDGVGLLGLSGIDMKSFAFALRADQSFRSTGKRVLPKRWFAGAPAHNHTALQDAIGQGIMFVRALKDAEDLIQ